jgi:hypothetical protein
MPLISSISDEIIALDLGAVVTQGAPDVVLTDPHVVSSYLGGDISVINRSGDAEKEQSVRRRGREQLRARA